MNRTGENPDRELLASLLLVKSVWEFDAMIGLAEKNHRRLHYCWIWKSTETTPLLAFSHFSYPGGSFNGFPQR